MSQDQGPVDAEHALDDVWQGLLRAAPQAPCVSAPGLEWSRQDFEQAIRMQAGALSGSGVATREVVAWLGLNTPQMLAALFACARLGAVFLPLNWRLTDEELRLVLRHAGARVLTGTPDAAVYAYNVLKFNAC